MLSYKKILSATAGLLVSLVCVMHGEWTLIPQAWAQGGVIPNAQGGIMETLLLLVGYMNVLAYFLMQILSYLIDPETIFGVTASNTIMLRLWQISRDIMNLLFAMMLLAGAIMTIVFGKQEVIKQHLVKFLLAVVLVNFSWFFPRVIIDIANVTTATIYGLPNLVNSKCKWIDENGVGQNCVVITDILYFENAVTGTCPPPPIPMAPIPPQEVGSIMKICLAPLMPGTNNGFGIINGLVTNHGRLKYLGVIAGSPPAGGVGGTVAEGLRFTIIMVMTTFLHFMLVFPLAALTMVMIIRIPILWLTVSFMPFMFIGFIIGDKFIKVNSMEIFTKHFITAAFLPAIVAIPFSIGYIMLNEVAAVSLSPNFLIPAGLSGKIPFFPQTQNLWQAIWILLAFMVIWMGSRAAMKRDEIYSKFTEPIFNVGNSFLKLPLAIPIPAGTNKDGTKKTLPAIGDMLNSVSTSRGLAQITGLRQPFDSPGGGAKASANNREILGALTQIQTATTNAGAMDANAIRLLDTHLRDQNIDTKTHAQVRQYITQMQSANPQGMNGINADAIANEIVKAAKPPQAPPAQPTS